MGTVRRRMRGLGTLPRDDRVSPWARPRVALTMSGVAALDHLRVFRLQGGSPANDARRSCATACLERHRPIAIVRSLANIPAWVEPSANDDRPVPVICVGPCSSPPLVSSASTGTARQAVLQTRLPSSSCFCLPYSSSSLFRVTSDSHMSLQVVCRCALFSVAALYPLSAYSDLQSSPRFLSGCQPASQHLPRRSPPDFRTSVVRLLPAVFVDDAVRYRSVTALGRRHAHHGSLRRPEARTKG